MELLLDPITVNCRKVLAGFKLIGADYTIKKIDYFQGEQKSPEYTAINPNQTIPTLRDGDLIIWESNPILQYVSDKVGNDNVYSNADISPVYLHGREKDCIYHLRDVSQVPLSYCGIIQA